ncbi:sialin [Nephila pilipes]|uniref:Sialin n=2 Tax=Nephila pilipes TaxID=299642 RepID=A0A8X6N4E8_NEPPI|nr:sialin [Nephila pilipes]
MFGGISGSVKQMFVSWDRCLVLGFEVGLPRGERMEYAATNYGGFSIALTFIAIPLIGCYSTLLITVLSIGLLVSGCRFSGFIVTSVDMSPDFSGTICGIASGIASLAGIVAPAVVGMVTMGEDTTSKWSDVFYISAAFIAATTILFAALGSAELQPWGKAEVTVKKDQTEICNFTETDGEFHDDKSSKNKKEKYFTKEVYRPSLRF